MLSLLAVPLILLGLGSYGLVNGDEGAYHGIAAGMVESGNWFRLDLLGEHRIYDTFMNAPLQYWARAVVITLFGSSLWTMRILSALFAVASVLMTYRLVLYIADRRAAVLAGIVQLTTLQFLYLHSARTGELEPVLCFVITLLAWCFVRAVLEGKSWIPHHLCLVLLINLKAPVVLIPLFAEICCFAALVITRPHFWRFARAACWVLPLGLTWHLAQMIVHWDAFLTVARQMGGEVAGAVDDQYRPGTMPGLESGLLRNTGFYVWVLLFGAFPYALVYPLAVVSGVRSGDTARERLPWKVLALFVLAFFVFYSIVDKHHAWYILPAIPLLSAFVGRWLSALGRRSPGTPLLCGAALVFALCVWLDVGLGELNPFATRAYRLPMDTVLRPPPAGAPWAAIAITTLVAAALLFGLRRVLGRRMGVAFASGLTLLLVGYAAVRVVSPLQHLGHRSETTRFHAELSERAARGEVVEYPLSAPVPFSWETRHYFGRDHEIVLHADLSYWLFEKGDQRAAHARDRTHQPDDLARRMELADGP